MDCNAKWYSRALSIHVEKARTCVPPYTSWHYILFIAKGNNSEDAKLIRADSHLQNDTSYMSLLRIFIAKKSEYIQI